MLASTDDVQALEAAFTSAEPAGQTSAQTGWLSGAAQGMLLLNVSAALFGSNQASVCMHAQTCNGTFLVLLMPAAPYHWHICHAKLPAGWAVLQVACRVRACGRWSSSWPRPT